MGVQKNFLLASLAVCTPHFQKRGAAFGHGKVNLEKGDGGDKMSYQSCGLVV